MGNRLYGTTQGGGIHDGGTVFSVTTGGKLQLIYLFTGGADGGGPAAKLLVRGGMFYGTTVSVGSHGGDTVFSVTPKWDRDRLALVCGWEQRWRSAETQSGRIQEAALRHDFRRWRW